MTSPAAFDGDQSDRAFGARGRARGPGTVSRVMLCLAPVVLMIGHLCFGANQALASQVLTALLALGALIAMATPIGRGLADLDGFDVLILLFGLVLLAAALSLTPWTLGGAHPLWRWAEVTPAAGTLDRSATLMEMVKLLGLGAAFTIGALQGARRDRAQATLEGLVWAGGAYALAALVIFAARLEVLVSDRLTGGLLSPNSAATVFGVLVVLALGVFLRAWRRSRGQGVSGALVKVAAPLATLMLSLGCLVLTASRMGLAATGVAVTVLLVWELLEHREGRAGVAAGALLAAGAAAVMIIGGDQLLNRFDTLGGDVDIRVQALEVHWNAFLAAPLTGSGLGGFDAVNVQMLTAHNIEALWSIRALHNVYLQWLEEAGIVGAAPMFLLVVVIMVQALRRGAATRSGRTLVHSLIAADLVVLIHGTADFALQVPSIAAFWSFVLGLQFAWGAARK